jgi:hypothetical protein
MNNNFNSENRQYFSMNKRNKIALETGGAGFIETLLRAKA